VHLLDNRVSDIIDARL